MGIRRKNVTPQQKRAVLTLLKTTPEVSRVAERAGLSRERGIQNPA